MVDLDRETFQQTTNKFKFIDIMWLLVNVCKE